MADTQVTIVGNLAADPEVTKGNGSSWIFEPRLTWANALR